MKSLINGLIKSPKTTAFGIVTGLIMILTQAGYFLDTDPETIVNWNIVVEGLAFMGIGVFARDHDKSSEDAGIK